MTVCLAAMCEDSKKIVVGSDRMWTAGILSLEFEHTRPKMVELSDSCMMMTAGPALRDLELKKYVKRELAGMSGVAIPLIVEKVKEGYRGTVFQSAWPNHREVSRGRPEPYSRDSDVVRPALRDL